MNGLQAFFQTISASIADLGALKVFLIAVAIALVWQVNKFIGIIAVILFIGYLAGWF